MDILKKFTGFVALAVVLLFASCGTTYRISPETLQEELQLVNNTLPVNRLINIPAKHVDFNKVDTDKQIKDVRITVDRKKIIYMVLKPDKGILENINASYYYKDKIHFFPDNAWVQNDTLHYVEYCSDINFKTIALSSINYVEVDFGGVKRKGKIRRGIWLEPSTTQRIDGLSISFATMPDFFCNVDTVNINGFNLGIEVQWIFGAAMGSLASVMALPYVIAAPFNYLQTSAKKKPQVLDTIYEVGQDTIDYIKKESDMDSIRMARNAFMDSLCRKDTPLVTVTGFNLGILGSSWQKNNNVIGVNICSIGTIANQIKGFSLTGGVSVIEEQNGIVISGLVNVVQKGKGLQIGVVNYSKQFKGLQLGLWNRNEKRSLPIVNWNFN